ncbi:uncharacterized protein SCALIN_C10_0096 [Candidatus Scalindua japonica]|uniref:Uncharacterized protein n=1 Tax=Candidatus Scalindua japonica TaxID=1284222 RepID=A0A286TWS5_9BACT|nr:AsmA-like C-terminal region-containing protein [Candidatus Scalindua japonica]GAX60336.1 uncharacterized protein SCALIN_C10_0096 [Candidatus Scalindua japonica]
MVKSKALLILIIVLAVFGCVLVGGYVKLKALTSDKAIKSRVTSALEDYTGGKLNIESAHFDFTKGITLDSINYEGKEPEKLRIEVEKIVVRYEPLALLRGEILINSIMIVSPELFLLRQKGAIWRFLHGVKAYLDHANIKYPTDHLRGGVIVKSADIHVTDKAVFKDGVLNIENVDFFGQQLGGSLRNINIRGAVNDGFWKGLEFNIDTKLANPELRLEARFKDKIMTEELMKKIPVIGERFWYEYSPLGKFDMDCTLNFNNKDDKRKLDYLFELDMIDGEATYVKWPFHIKHVNGKLEYSREGVFLRSIKGDIQNEGQQTNGEIDAFFDAGNARKNIKLNIPDFNITETLLKMVPDVGEKVWNDYHPSGNIDLTINYRSNEDNSISDYSVKASCKGIEAKNPFLPYDLSNIIGLMEMDGKNIYLKNMSGYLLNGPKINHSTIDGVINLKSKEKRFTVSIPNLDMTENLVKSIPKKGEAIWFRYKPTGQVDFMLDYKGFEDSSKDEYIITVDGKGNEIEYADLSIKMTDVIGRVVVSKNDVQLKNMRGYIINGDQLARTVCDGLYILRSKDKKVLYNVFDLRVTQEFLDKFTKQVKRDWFKIEPEGWVSVVLDDEIIIKEGKERQSIIIDAKGCKFRLINFPLIASDVDGRISIVDGQLASRKINGSYCGGSIQGAIEADISSPEGEYSGEFHFDKVSLPKLMESFVKEQQEWTGVCEGGVEFEGINNNLMSFTAQGSAKLRDGHLAEIPVLLSILKILNLSVPKKESFQTADLKYSVKNKIVNIEELEIFSDSIELGCIGTVKFDGTIDLTVVAGLNRETFSQIPFIGNLMDFVVGGVRKKLTKVQITGTLSNPVTKMIGFKPFTDSVKRIVDVLVHTNDNTEEAGKQKNVK